MFTFLPEEYKKKVVGRYRLKLALVYTFLFCIIFGTGFVLILPSYVLGQWNRRASLVEKNAAGVASEGQVEAISKEVRSLKEKLAIIESSESETPITVILEKILSRKGPDILIKSIQLKRNADVGAITIDGTASTREALVSFSKLLEGEPSFSSVNLPVGSFAKSKDIPWSITINSKF